MTAGNRGKRAGREDAALAALLAAPTIADAAKLAGISESTLLRWLADPSFRTRFRDARRQVVEHSVSRLQQATSEAVDALRRNLTCGIPAVEVGAARSVLDQSIKAVELIDLAERVEDLERSAELAARLEQKVDVGGGSHGPEESDGPPGDASPTLPGRSDPPPYQHPALRGDSGR